MWSLPLVLIDASRAALVVAAVSLPFSTALTNLSAALAFVCWALSAQWRATFRCIAAEPAAWVGSVLFAGLVVGITWSLVAPREAAEVAVKYRELFLFGIAMFLFGEARWRYWLLSGFFLSGVVLLCLSYAVHFQMVQFGDPIRRASQGAVVMKSSITHSLLMSLLAYGAVVVAMHVQGWWRVALAAVAVLAAVNVVTAVQGRTGYLVLAALALWLVALRWSPRAVLISLLAGAALAAAAYQWAPTFQTRVDKTGAEARQYAADPTDNSIAQRLHYWRRSLQWIAEHPLLGAGTGAWGEAFHQSSAQDHPFFRDRAAHRHPHNEYLSLAVQLGVGGLALFVALLVLAFRRARALPGPEGPLAQGLVIAFAVGCLFNDFLLDTTEGHVWAVLGGALFGASRKALPPGR